MGKDASDAFESADKVLAAYDKHKHLPPEPLRRNWRKMESRSLRHLARVAALCFGIAGHRCRWLIQVFCAGG